MHFFSRYNLEIFGIITEALIMSLNEWKDDPIWLLFCVSVLGKYVYINILTLHKTSRIVKHADDLLWA